MRSPTFEVSIERGKDEASIYIMEEQTHTVIFSKKYADVNEANKQKAMLAYIMTEVNDFLEFIS